MTNNLIQSVFEQYLERNPIDDITVSYMNDTNYQGIVIESSSDVGEHWLNHACYYLIQRVDAVEARWRLDDGRDRTYIIDLPERSTVFTVPTILSPAMRFQ
jgi:hypothetical protein